MSRLVVPRHARARSPNLRPGTAWSSAVGPSRSAWPGRSSGRCLGWAIRAPSGRRCWRPNWSPTASTTATRAWRAEPSRSRSGPSSAACGSRSRTTAGPPHRPCAAMTSWPKRDADCGWSRPTRSCGTTTRSGRAWWRGSSACPSRCH